MPSVPPYSSTTIARCWFSRRISLSAVSTPAVPGSRFDLAGEVADGRGPAGRVVGQEQVADVHEADDVVLVAAGHRVTATSWSRRRAWRRGWRSWTRRGTSTSVRGVMTSRTSRSPARKTSSISRRSSLLSDSWAATRSRSSSWLIDSPLTFGSPPKSRTRRSVDFDSSQMIGRDIVAIALSGAATISEKPSARCRASRFGVSSPTTSDR